MGLTGKHYDPKSGLVDFDFRWYDPQAGRFTQPDTFKGRLHEPGTQHPYAYVGNNPINYIDPDGHDIDYDDLTNEEIQEILDDLYGDGDTDEDSNDGGSSGGSGSDDSDSGDDDDYDTGGSSGGGSDDDDYSPPPPPTPEEKQEEFNSNVLASPNIRTIASHKVTTSEEPDSSWTWRDTVGTGVSFIPIIGDAYDIGTAISGVDPITGRKMSGTERLAVGFGTLVPFVSGGMIKGGIKVVKHADEVGL